MIYYKEKGNTGTEPQLSGISAELNFIRDDLIIAAPNMQSHDTLKVVLHKKIEVGLTLNLEKCAFRLDRIDSLLECSDVSQKHQTKPLKTDFLQQASLPQKQERITQGDFYRWFNQIQNFSRTCKLKQPNYDPLMIK